MNETRWQEVDLPVVVEEDAFRVQDDGHRFGAMSPQIPLIVSDRGAQGVAPSSVIRGPSMVSEMSINRMLSGLGVCDRIVLDPSRFAVVSRPATAMITAVVTNVVEF